MWDWQIITGIFGDEKDFTLSTGEVITVQIYGFNHDNLISGTGKAGITFGTKYLMNAMQYMQDPTIYNYGAFYHYGSTTLRSYVSSTVLNQMPENLRNKIKCVSKTSFKHLESYSESVSKPITNEYVFLFSQEEIYGLSRITETEGGSQYQYFKNGGSPYKSFRTGGGTDYWTRSACIPYAETGYYIATSDTSYGWWKNIHSMYAVAFGFCI